MDGGELQPLKLKDQRTDEWMDDGIFCTELEFLKNLWGLDTE
jgi:hypothetical protein